MQIRLGVLATEDFESFVCDAAVLKEQGMDLRSCMGDFGRGRRGKCQTLLLASLFLNGAT